MNILIVTQYFWPENFRINDLVRGLLERGNCITVLTGIPNYPGGRFFAGYGFFRKTRQDYFGATVLRVPLFPRGNAGGLRLAFNYLSFAFFASFLAPFLCRKKIDLIFVFGPSPITVGIPALLLKKIKAAPVFFWVQDLWPESLVATGAIRSSRILNLVRWLAQTIYRGCDRILVTSESYIKSIQKFHISSERFYYFPQSAESFYQPMSQDFEAPELQLLPKGFRIMFAGNIGVAQDFSTILAAAEILKSHPDIHFVVLGDGRMKDWVESEVQLRNLTNTVHLLGRHPSEVMPKFFAYADAMLVTLKKDHLFSLTIPAKLQSYLACGRPIIAALDGEGARLVEKARAGFACPAGNPEALVRAILQLYEMPQGKREEFGQFGRAFYLENFERNRLIDRLFMWMQEFRAC